MEATVNGNLTDVHWLLIDLGSKGGYCDASRHPERFVPLVADGPEKFADAVLLAEGLDPLTMDKRQRLGVIALSPNDSSYGPSENGRHAARIRPLMTTVANDSSF